MSTSKIKKPACYAALLLLLCGSAAAQGGTILYVHCGASTGLNSVNAALKALQSSEEHGAATIYVSGACHENILVQNMDRLTLNAVQGASISDASGGVKDVIDVNNSLGFTLRGFTVSGGVDAVSCYGGSHCLLVQNTVQGAQYDGIGVYPTATGTVVGGVLQNNGFSGLLVVGEAVAAGVAVQNNLDRGVVVNNGGRLVFRISDPAFDGVSVSTPGLSRGNGSFGIRVTRGATITCSGCDITGNTSDGVNLEFGATATFQSYSLSNSTTQTTISGNGGSGVSLGALANATFFDATTVTGNAQPEIVCHTPTSVTNGALAAAGGVAHTNCTN